jgi:lysozyme family protein
MADPNIAIQKTLQNEGGFTCNSADPGGATNMGITQADLPNINIKNLTMEQAQNYYSENYWKPLYSEIENQDVANKLFDLGVLFGVGTAVKLLQEVLQTGFGLLADGSFGPITLSAINQTSVASLLQSYKTHAINHAVAVANANAQERVFLTGWINRINS